MVRVAVDSTTLAGVGYDAAQEVLELEFRSGRVYQYFEVPPERHQGLMDAESKGSYFNAYIRPLYGYAHVSRGRRGRW